MEDVKMSENQKKILQMLAEGKIKVDEAQRLLVLTKSDEDRENGGDSAGQKNRSLPRFLRVIVEPKPGALRREDQGKVNVRVPLGLIRAGMKLATLIPSDATEQMDRAFKEKGFSFDIKKLKDEDIEELITALQESEVDVDTENEVVRVFAE